MASVEAPSLAGLYRAHADLVWRTLVRFGVPEHDAEDLVHEVFLVARRRLPEFDPRRAAPSSWLYGLSRGVAANWRRAERRAARRLELVERPSAPSDPEVELARGQAAALVDGFLATLEPAQREVFVLCDVEGVRAPEVAALLGVGVNQVYSRLRLARRRFVAHLEARGIAVADQGVSG